MAQLLLKTLILPSPVQNEEKHALWKMYHLMFMSYIIYFQNDPRVTDESVCSIWFVIENYFV